MRSFRTLSLLVGICALPSVTLSQGGTIGVYSDREGTSIRFDLNPTCSSQYTRFGGYSTFRNDLSDSFPPRGTVYYDTCLSGGILVFQWTVQVPVASRTCCIWRIAPDPDAPGKTIEVTDCAGGLTAATPTTSYFNSDGSCSCAVPTHDSTWGRIRGLWGGGLSYGLR